MKDIKQIYQDHTGQWREENPFTIEHIDWALFEVNLIYHDFPNAPEVKPGEVVMAYLQWQWECHAVWININDVDELRVKFPNSLYRQVWVLADQQEGKEEQPTKNQPEPPVDADYINKPANLNTLQSPSAPKVEVSAEDKVEKRFIELVNYDINWAKTEIKNLPKVNDGTERAYFEGFILGAGKTRQRAIEQYATLKTSSLQQENDKLREEIIDEFDYETTYTKHDIIRILNALNKQ